MKRLLIIALLVALLTACTDNQPVVTKSPDFPVTQEPMNTPMPPEQSLPNDPQPGDELLSRGNVYMDTTELLTLESYPLQFSLSVSGDLPTPCHQLRYVVGQPDEQNNIEIEMYSVVNPDAICVQMLQAFDTSIPLGSFPAGHYTVSINGEQVAEFDA